MARAVHCLRICATRFLVIPIGRRSFGSAIRDKIEQYDSPLDIGTMQMTEYGHL